jgi:hypothetical protein
VCILASSSHRRFLMWRYSRIFGDDCQARRSTPIELEETQFQRMIQQHAARHALALSQTQASTPEDSEVQAPAPGDSEVQAADSDLA